MLRIIHTGRAYEVLDLLPVNYRLKDEHVALKVRYWRQGAELEQACREIGDLKEFLAIVKQELRDTELELKLCRERREL